MMYNVRAETLLLYMYVSYGEAGKRFLFHLKLFYRLFYLLTIKSVLCPYASYLHLPLFFSFLILVSLFIRSGTKHGTFLFSKVR